MMPAIQLTTARRLLHRKIIRIVTMFTLYELEVYAKDYQKMRMKQREAEIKWLLSQPEPRRPFRIKFRLPKFILKWIEQEEGCAEPLQECPELA
jgi:hypothetical protein